MYKFLIIGKGLFGTAAARYLSQTSNSVAIIGPDEPKEWSTHQGVFSSHYDQGRIASITGPDEIWSQLDRASMGQYRALEEASGISFYTPSGRISVSHSTAINQYPYHAATDENTQIYTTDTLPETLPIRFPPNDNIYLEGSPSGYINPREMIRAQLTIAVQQGVDVISEMVVAVQNQGSHVEVKTASGRVVQAEKVLLATGAFTNCLGLLPRSLALRNQSLTVLLAEVSPADANRLQHLPPINYKIESDSFAHLYLLPPLRYPNGRYYLKLGCSSPTDRLLPSLDALRDWFQQGGSNDHIIEMQAVLLEILPNLHVLAWETKPCVICYTPSGKPMIDVVEQGRIYVVAGGNGGGAHPSDAIGHLAAGLMQEEHWVSMLDPEPFQIQFADEWSTWMETMESGLPD